MAPFPSVAGRAWLNSLPRTLGDQLHARINLGTTPTTADTPTLVDRQATTTVTVVSDNGGGGGGAGLSGGAIAGIVIGSVFGVLLLLWIIRSCFNLGAPPQEREKWYNDVDPAPRRHHHRRHRSRSTSVGIPPPVIIADGRSRSRHSRRASHGPPNVVYTSERDRERGRRYH